MTERGDIQILIPGRPRDLGGLQVSRVLPALRQRSVGPYLFLDHLGPVQAGSINVRPHPHIHLATVTYLFDGEIHHRDSLGSDQVITPGAINWMTAGSGVVHSERSDREMHMHGLQLWVGLPKATEDIDASFAHYPAESFPAFEDAGARIRVLLGSALGATSPVSTLSPMVYLDVTLEAGGRVGAPGGYEERAIYVVGGSVTIGGARVGAGELAVLVPGSTPTIASEDGARFVLLGGEPLDGPRYMWWNFVSSDKQRIVEAAHRWRAGKFPKVPGDEIELIPAPPDDPHFAGSGYRPPSDAELREILIATSTIAMVGASNNPAKPSYRIMKDLLDAGYHVIPVNPSEREVLGQRAVASLRDITEKVDVVDVFRKSEDTPAIADEAVAIGANVLWLQEGISNDIAAAKALAGGLQVVMNLCMGATHRRLRIAKK